MPVRSPVKLRHTPCQKLLQPVLTCMACGQPVTYAQGRIRIAKALAQMEAGVTSHLKAKHAAKQTCAAKQKP